MISVLMAYLFSFSKATRIIKFQRLKLCELSLILVPVLFNLNVG